MYARSAVLIRRAAVARLVAAGVDVVGANCSTGPRGVFEVLSRYDAAASGVRLSAMPNAGYPESRGERLFYPAPPDYFADYARQFLSVGARLIGGCCGTTPDHIVGVRRALDEALAHPIARRVSSVAGRPARLRRWPFPPGRPPRCWACPHSPPPWPPDGSSPRSKWNRRRVPTPTPLEANARLLRDAGVTTLNISDTPMARMRMTGLAAAVKVQQATGLEPVLHFPVRGRNLLRVQGDLLAAHALGVRTLFVTMGDLASIGDYPQAFDHHDIVPTGLVRVGQAAVQRGRR